MRHATSAAAILAAALLAGAAAGPALASPDYPHTWENGATCVYCHDLLSPADTYLPPWTQHVQQNIDDTAVNTLCWSCHTGIEAPFAVTHSSLNTTDRYGDADDDGEPGWSMQCIDCHDPHFQSQLRQYAGASYVASGTVAAVAGDTLTASGAGWTDDAFAGYLLAPNVLENGLNYRILGNTADTITVSAPIDAARVHPGDDFAVVFGRIVRAGIDTPEGGPHEVRLFRPSGANSFADGDAVYDGVCEVCHTRTEHFRCTGDAPDQEHDDLGPFAGIDCRGCHGHTGGFAHGTGDAAPGCDACHGHDEDYAGGSYAGTTESHSTHTDGDADDARGVALTCDSCHDTGDFPSFASGTDANGDGRIDLAETDVCDGCHSPGGTYDGVNDPTLGAKANWEEGIYEDGAPRPGTERWCANCHDESPSTIGGVAAPNVVGDEGGAFTYGQGWGFYRTGHGLPATATYPASGGVTAGAGAACDACHDTAAAHVDGLARTFDDADLPSTPPSAYRAGYRLRLVGGLEPLEVPWPAGISLPNGADRYRLCAGCHDTGPFTDAGNTNTNFVSGGLNRHVTHLGGDTTVRFPADWSGANTSRMTCVACHNVHGTTRLAMVRDGALTGRDPGVQIWYYNAAVSVCDGSNPDPPEPEDLPLAASTGVCWIGLSAGNLCTHCHANGNTVPLSRTPFQDVSQAPTLAWTGETGYEADGAHPDAAVAGAEFTFRVLYADLNNDEPLEIQVWVDRTDDGDFDDPGERIDLAATPPGDPLTYDGRVYTASVTLDHAGDDVLAYRFHASDGLEATGPPTIPASVTLLNGPPRVAWTGEAGFEEDGVDPDVGPAGAPYEFRVLYTDDDGDLPASIRVWVDADDDGVDDAGEAHDLAAAAGGNGDTTDGEVYTAILALAHAGDGRLAYRFEAADAGAAATAEAGPLAGGEVVVGASGNAPPELSWASAPCLTEGVRPRSGAAGADFGFIVSYRDADDPCPASGGGDVALWVDLDDSGTYGGGEGFPLEELDALDTDCTDGKLYGLTLALAAAGDGELSYYFAATDGTEAAVGVPTLGALVGVAAATKVRPGGGTGWEGSIADAVNNNPGLTLVYPNADFTAATYPQTFLGNARNDRTARAVCGPALTVIDAAGAAYAVMSQNNSNLAIEGFTLTGGASYGLQVNGGNPVLLTDSVVTGNAGSGVYTPNASLVISGCEIAGNGAAADYGGGVNVSAGTHSITDTSVHDNSANINGGGLFIQNAVSATLERLVVTGNTAGTTGGGVFLNNSATGLRSCEVSGNTATAGHGGGVYLNNNTVSFEACTITGNTAGGDGGGLYQTGTPNVTLENTLLADNEAARGGGAFVNDIETPALLVNATVAGNRATAGDGGAYYLACAAVAARNTIFWGNTATGSGQTFYKGGCTAPDSELTDSLVTTGEPWIHGGTWVASGNLDPAPDPLFAGGGDYHLRDVSPAIDAAGAAWAPDADIDGDARPQGAADDIGADERLAANAPPTLAWTGEAGYEADGADPDSGPSGTSFTFRASYADAENEPPLLVQVWVDENDDGSYSAGEKHDLAAVTPGDTTYTDGKLYTATLALAIAGDGVIPYRFSATDGTSDATGPATVGGAVTLLNNAPALSWTGEAGYTSDGADPDGGPGGTSFTFRVDYTDADGTPPAEIEVWVDADDSGTYEAGEKHPLAETDPGDTDCTDGKRYATTRAVGFAGDGSLWYRFHASDGTDEASGAPTSGRSLAITNSAPTLAWTGEGGYEADGVDPDAGGGGDTFTFRVDYADPDGTPPATIEVWVDADDSGTYEAGEKHPLAETDPGDTDCTDGKRYALALVLDHAGDGQLAYEFHASDGTAAATGDPTTGGSVAVSDVANTAPTLAWSPAACRAEGVRPPLGSSGSDFEFLVSYADAEDQCATSIQVWIDENDDGSYDAGEQYDLSEDDPGDTTCTDGKLYRLTRAVAAAGDGTLPYRYFASDGTFDATGPPVAGGTLRALAGTTVRPAGSALPLDYTSIIAAANAVTGPVVVYPNDDFTAATYTENVFLNNRDDLTLVAACGPDLTVVASPSATSATITAQGTANLVVEGFSITGATSSYGVNVNGLDATTLTIRSCRVFGNATGIYVNDGDDVPVRIEGCEIYGNSVRGINLVSSDDDADIRDTVIRSHTVGAQNGVAVLANNGNTVTLTRCEIRDNTTTGSGALSVNAAGASLTILDSLITGNQAANGGAINMAIGATATIARTVISGNAATAQGGAIYTNAAGFTMTNAIVAGNQAGTNGGAISTNSGPTISIVNSTFADNQGVNGGVFYFCAPGVNTIRNSIFWNNTATGGNGANIYKGCGTGNIGTISDSDMTTSAPAIYNATFTDEGGIISPALDPLFAGGGDYHLQGGSPAIGQANAAYAPDDDIDGDPRPQGGADDLGADEYVP